MVTNEDQWGELVAMQVVTIQRLEMADALLRIEEQDDGLINDALQSAVESSQRGCRT